MQKCQANISFDVASAYPVLLGIVLVSDVLAWFGAQMKKKSNQIKSNQVTTRAVLISVDTGTKRTN